MASRKRRENETQEDYRANLKKEEAENKHILRRGFLIANNSKYGAYKKKDKTIPTHYVFKCLIDILRADNGGCEIVYYEDFKRCESAISKLIGLDYFKDDPNNIDGCFWMMGAAEESERKAYFDKDEESCEAISDVLNNIFEREPFTNPDVGDRES